MLPTTYLLILPVSRHLAFDFSFDPKGNIEKTTLGLLLPICIIQYLKLFFSSPVLKCLGDAKDIYSFGDVCVISIGATSMTVLFLE